MKRPLLAVLCLALSALCISSQLAAAPHYGTPWQLKQPDGSFVDVRVWGDEYYQVVETPDGYTLMRDPSNDWIVYAALSADGNELVSTGVRYGAGSPVQAGVTPHLRINIDVARAKAQQMREIAFPETPAMRIGGEPKAVPPSTGNVVGLCLIVDFDDNVATISRDEVANYCNQVGYSGFGNNGSVHDYFFDVSNGNLNYTLYVPPAYHRASQQWTYYDDCTQPWLARAIELIKEILDQMETDGFDFSGYDANGDGEIDAINLFYAGNGRGCGWAEGMWPGSFGVGGNGWMYDGLLANRCQITDMQSSLSLDTFCHENGHMIGGLPDLYDYDGDSAGVGGFDIMCNAMSNTNPVEPSAYCKQIAGWATPTDLTTLATGINLPTSSSNTMFRWAKSGTEYYLIENRQKTGRDAAVPDHGLALWHIDTAGNNSDEDMLPGLHYLVTLVQADGDWDLEGNVNQGDGTDLYAAPTFTAATPCTDPNTDWWDGTESALSITNISTSQATMTFDFSPEDNAPVAITQDTSGEADEECCITIDVEDIDNGSNDPDGPGDIASLCITQVDGVDVGCQQSVELCGDGDHTVRLTITDLCGNSSSSDATVEVIDVTPPTISFEVDRDVLWPPNHKMVTVCAEVTATDNCDDDLTIALVSIVSDEPDNDKGDGNTVGDIQNATTGTEDLCFDLRSERQGTGDGRCYTITYSATDDAGNSTNAEVCVEVPHDMGANALASLGFNPDGTALIDDVNSFAVFVLGSATLDVSTIDLDHIYVGNTRGVVQPTGTQSMDVNLDGDPDLAVKFENLDADELTFAEVPRVIGSGGALDVKKDSDGPIGLHFVAAGVNYLVSNIYALGAPVELPGTIGGDTPDPMVETITRPVVTGLTSVHPNPFNPQTTVNFSLATASQVRIAIYDVTGSLVRRLVDESMPAGDHQAQWDGRNDAGNGATSGVYFVRMVAGSFSEVRKIVMLK